MSTRAILHHVRRPCGAVSAGPHRRAPLRLAVTGALGLAWIAAALGALLAPTDAGRIAAVLAAWLVGAAAFVWLFWRIFATPPARPGRTTIALVLATSAITHAILIAAEPATSPDIWRYLWEGILQRHGENPFVTPPASPELAALASEHASLHERVTFPHMVSIYPPVAQWAFRLAAGIREASPVAWKSLLAACEAALLALLWWSWREDALRLGIVLTLAWCPLLIIETAEAGHVDVIGVLLLVAAVVLFERGSRFGAGAACGLAAMVKYLWPAATIVLLTARIGEWRGRARFMAGAAAVVALAWWPFRHGLDGALATLAAFTQRWTFNDVVMEGLRKAVGTGSLAPALALALLAGASCWLGVTGRRRAVWDDLAVVLPTALVLSPVAYPWYFLWLVPAVVARPQPWLIAWVLGAGALHLVDLQLALTGRWDPMPWLWGALFVAPAAGLTRCWLERVRRNPRAATPAPRPTPSAIATVAGRNA